MYSRLSELEEFVFSQAVQQVREHNGISYDDDDDVTDICVSYDGL